MQFFRFWARGTENINTPDGQKNFTAYGFSNESVEDALRVAHERALANANARGRTHSSDQQYYANNVPLREEIIQELVAADNEKVVISRNKYGCLVLNTPHVFFADIDKPARTSSEENPLATVVGFFQNLFGGNEPDTKEPEDSFENGVIEKIEQLINQHHGMIIRLYRTSNGFRAMIMNETIPCQLAKSHQLLNAFGSDELYVSLCRSQDCYRARLTPKPWRCGMRQHNTRYPFLNQSEQDRFLQWQADYEKRSVNFATCALIGNFGNGVVDQTCQQIAEVHDTYALNGNLPLA